MAAFECLAFCSWVNFLFYLSMNSFCFSFCSSCLGRLYMMTDKKTHTTQNNALQNTSFAFSTIYSLRWMWYLILNVNAREL